MSQTKIRQSLEAIPKRRGRLLAADVVQAAKDPQSPLHSRFEWDDTKAGHAYRLWQARKLIVSVMVVYDDKAETVAPVFVSLDADRKEGGYREVSVVLGSPELRKEMLRTALRELQQFELRYKRFKELNAVFQATRRVGKKIGASPKEAA